jgi:hypothetical protein
VELFSNEKKKGGLIVVNICTEFPISSHGLFDIWSIVDLILGFVKKYRFGCNP